MRYIAVATFLSFAIASFAPTHAQETVFIIRHAEKETSGADPRLIDAGRRRAASWADMLRPGGIDVIITSDAKRTRETGGIIAERLGVSKMELPRQDVVGLVDMLQFDHADDNVLIVAHTETIPSIVSSLGVPETVEISQEDFATLLIVMPGDDADARLVALRMP